MSSLITELGIDRLCEADRIQLLDELMETLNTNRKLPPLCAELQRELERRIELFNADPAAVRPWHEVQARVFARIKGAASEP